MDAAYKRLKKMIIESLSHPEAEDGLYFNNMIVVHEEEERPAVEGKEEDILNVLQDMINDGEISTDETGESVIFKLVQH
jgi:hypothetical protein